jgi:hypothetical protein
MAKTYSRLRAALRRRVTSLCAAVTATGVSGGGGSGRLSTQLRCYLSPCGRPCRSRFSLHGVSYYQAGAARASGASDDGLRCLELAPLPRLVAHPVLARCPVVVLRLAEQQRAAGTRLPFHHRPLAAALCIHTCQMVERALVAALVGCRGTCTSCCSPRSRLRTCRRCARCWSSTTSRRSFAVPTSSTPTARCEATSSWSRTRSEWP